MTDESGDLTVKQIVERAGGASAIARAAEERGVKLKVFAVYKWSKIGIPQKHWTLVTSMSQVSAQQIFEANERLKSAPAEAAASGG
jgi:hypothetical protein